MKVTIISCIISIIVITGIPTGFIVAFSYIYPKPVIDKSKCTCECFDTIIRGPFPSKTYRSIFVNGTVNTFVIYCWFVIHILLYYEAVRYIVNLLFATGTQVRLVFLGLILLNIYPNFYAWWHVFIYVNNEMYVYIRRQLIYHSGELLVTVIDFWLLNTENQVKLSHVFFSTAVNLNHAIMMTLDQKVFDGTKAQIVRNIFLLLPDLFHLLIYFYFLYHCKERPLKRLQWITWIVLFLVYFNVLLFN